MGEAAANSIQKEREIMRLPLCFYDNAFMISCSFILRTSNLRQSSSFGIYVLRGGRYFLIHKASKGCGVGLYVYLIMAVKDLGKTLFCGFRSACDLHSTSGIVITITPTAQLCFYVSLEMIAVFDINR